MQRVVDPTVAGVVVEPLKRSATPAWVERLHLRYAGAPRVATLILKRIAPDWPGDPGGATREITFYRVLRPRLELPGPRCYHAGPAPDDSGERWLLLEDLAPTHRFPPPTRRWRDAEARALLATYARLHAAGRDALPDDRDWLFPPYAQQVVARAGELPGLFGELAAIRGWAPLPGLPRLVARVLAGIERWGGRAVTLLHNDVYPPNGALPRDPARDPVMLVDWEMVGSGLPELDLAYCFFQPHGADRDLDRTALQEWYWRERARAEGGAPDPERHAIQRHADALLALWLIPVAHGVATAPHPEGSAPHAYWASMFPRLERRLRELDGDG